MLTQRQKNTIQVLTVVIAALLVLPAFTGCQRMQELDKALWGPPAPEPTSQPAGGTGGAYQQPGLAPPIIELTAALLAAGGFGGMATWIKRIRRKENGRIDNLADRIQDLEYKNAERSHES